MAMIKCPECSKEVSDKAINCPNCGCPIAEEKKVVKPAVYTYIDMVFYGIGILILIGSIIAGIAIGSGYRGSPSTGWTIFLVGFIQMWLFIGFGKVIEILYTIANRQ